MLYFVVIILQADDIPKTRQWFKALQFYGLCLGNWRRRRNALANIMINGMARDHRHNSYNNAGKDYDHVPYYANSSALPTTSGDTNNGPMFSSNGSHRSSAENLL